MNFLQSPVIRILLTLVLGGVLIVWPNTALLYIVMFIGVFFLVPGIASLLFYLQRDKEDKQNKNAYLPIESIGSILLGLSLVILPSFFVSFIMYVLGFLLILGAVYQLLLLITMGKKVSVANYLYIFPLLVLIAGVVILINPFDSIARVLILFGVSTVVYGLIDLINYLKFK